MSKIVRTYVRLMLEKVKSKKGVKSSFGDKFDMNKFKSFDNINVMKEYAATFLTELGEGSSRAGYLLSHKYVLKIALNEKGLSQNQTEVEVGKNPAMKNFVTKIYAVGNHNAWLITDVVKELTSSQEFKSLTGSDWTNFRMSLIALMREDDEDEDIDELDEFAIDVAKAARTSKLIYGDLIRLDHWGKTADGRVVLLDYGYTEDVWSKHYKKTAPTPEDATAPQKPPKDDNTKKG